MILFIARLIVVHSSTHCLMHSFHVFCFLCFCYCWPNQIAVAVRFRWKIQNQYLPVDVLDVNKRLVPFRRDRLT